MKSDNIKLVSKIGAFIELTRAGHGVMIIVAIFIGALITGSLPGILKFIMAAMTGLFLEMASFALNDYFDVEIDKANKRMDRPIVRGEMKREHALYIYLILTPIAIAASIMVNFYCFIIALIAFFLSTIYDAKLKRIKLIGNFYIAFASSIPFIFGALTIKEEVPVIIWILFVMAFLASSGREIMKDVIDVEGDKKAGVKSFASIFGIKTANAIASSFYIIAVAISLLPFFINFSQKYFHDMVYAITISIPDVLFLYIIYILLHENREKIRKCRKYSLLAMLLAMFAMLVSAFI